MQNPESNNNPDKNQLSDFQNSEKEIYTEDSADLTDSIDPTAASPQESESPKKSFTLIIIEVVLLLIVIALAVIYFTQKNNVTQPEQLEEPASNNTNSQNASINNSITASVETKPTTVTKTTSQAPPPSTPRKLSSTEEDNLRMKLTPPAQSVVMTEDSIPHGAIKILGTSTGFEPKEFTVKAGEEIILALTSRIDLPVVLTFYNNNMPPVSIGCGPRETRWVTLKAPTTKGEYIFKNDVIGHNNETGKMIVN